MIIQSLIDTDLYKLTMMQAVLHRFPSADVEYHFHCRTPGATRDISVDRVREEIAGLCALRFTEDELDYLGSLRFIKKDFVEILRVFQLQQDHVHVTHANDELKIIIEGPWLHTILFEVPLLSILSEIYGESKAGNQTLQEGIRRLDEKIDIIQSTPGLDSFRIAEFGTRRRFSHAWQKQIIKRMHDAIPEHLVGTSNVLFAKELGIPPLGTMAHEFLQACQAAGPRLVDSQRYALENWVQEYRGDLGIALTDVIGLEAFLRDFDLYFCKLFDGVRHDSGDPFVWGEKMLEHYRNMRVDARTKSFVFSDGLNIEKAIRLYRHFRDRVQVSFGIGTNLTNDLGFEPPSMVVKMVRCNGQAVAKISDDPDKTLCTDMGYLQYLKKVFNVPQHPTRL